MASISLRGAAGSAVSRGRASTGSIPGAGTATVVVPFSPAMADTAYTASVTVEDTSGDLRVAVVTAKTTTSVSVLVLNSDTLNAASGTLHVLAVHD